MQSPDLVFSLVFGVLLIAGLVVRTWLASRQIRHVARHRGEVPAAFANTITPQAHQKAADYTVAKARFGMLDGALEAALLLGWTLFGGLHWLNQTLLALMGGGMAQQLALVAAFSVIAGLLGLPAAWWSTFRIEERFGFNKMSLGLWLGDLLKNAVVGRLAGLAHPGPGAVAHGRSRAHLVALGLGRLDGFQPVDAGGLPHRDRTFVQQIRAAAGRNHQAPGQGLDGPLRLCGQRPLRDGRQQTQRPRQRLFHRFWSRQTGGVLRHLAGTAGAR